jgi:NAD(P)-dependent dehydrogenase (short-subunit alcohol dehydrogenase family)
VTGAASGIGAAIATLFAASGARVALLARRRDRLVELAAKIDGFAVPTDVTDGSNVDAAVRAVHESLGPVDLLVNAAGVMLPNPIADGRVDEWRRMVDTNLTGLLLVTRVRARPGRGGRRRPDRRPGQRVVDRRTWCSRTTLCMARPRRPSRNCRRRSARNSARSTYA